LPGQCIDNVHREQPPRNIVLGMDSSESPTYGEQKASAYKGISAAPAITRCSCSTSWTISSDALCCWRAVLEPVIARYQDTLKRLYFRGDAAFAERRAGIADLMRVNKFRPVWVKSPAAQRHRALLTVREQLRRQALDAHKQSGRSCRPRGSGHGGW
jgi:hypothetical protein